MNFLICVNHIKIQFNEISGFFFIKSLLQIQYDLRKISKRTKNLKFVKIEIRLKLKFDKNDIRWKNFRRMDENSKD